MLWIKLIKSIIGLLHSAVSPRQIAGGIALGSIIGFTPFFTIQNLILFLIILMIQVNIGAAIFAIGVFGIAGYFLDPLAHWIGYQLLVNVSFLTPLWTNLYNMPIVPFTRFYNTIVLGSIVISLVLFVPILIAAERFIVYYRSNLQSRVEKLKIVKLFKLTGIYGIYSRYR